MRKQSSRLLCFVSLFLVLVSCSVAEDDRPPLKQSDLTNPSAVVAILKTGQNKNAQVRAALFYKEGVKFRAKAKAGKSSWGPVAKSFGTSALYYPRPLALMGYAEASLRDIGMSNKPRQVQHAVLNGAFNKYKSAAAADDILKELTAAQRTELNHYLQCIARNLENKPSAPCPPVEWVGLYSEPNPF